MLYFRNTADSINVTYSVTVSAAVISALSARQIGWNLSVHRKALTYPPGIPLNAISSVEPVCVSELFNPISFTLTAVTLSSELYSARISYAFPVLAAVLIISASAFTLVPAATLSPTAESPDLMAALPLKVFGAINLSGT